MNDFRSQNVLHFDYVSRIPTVGLLTASTSGQVILTIAQDSWFELHRILGTHSQDNSLHPQPHNFSVQITDLATGRQLSNLRVPQPCFAGPANVQSALLKPILFPPGANLQFDVLDLSAVDSSVQLVLRGLKFFSLTNGAA